MGYVRKSNNNDTIGTVQHGTVDDRRDARRIELATSSVMNYGPAAEERLLPSRQPSPEVVKSLRSDPNWELRRRMPTSWLGSKGSYHPEF